MPRLLWSSLRISLWWLCRSAERERCLRPRVRPQSRLTSPRWARQVPRVTNGGAESEATTIDPEARGIATEGGTAMITATGGSGMSTEATVIIEEVVEATVATTVTTTERAAAAAAVVARVIAAGTETIVTGIVAG